MPDATFLLSTPADFTADSGANVNATATATIAAPGSGKAIYVLGVSFSSSGQPTAPVTATLVDGSGTNRGRWNIPAAAFAPIEIGWSRARHIPENTAVTLTLPALGTGITGTCQIHYALGPR